MTLLSVEHVAAHYGASQALFDVSLTLAEGEVLALLGRNGMGKTTTVKTICKLLPTTSGRVTFDGQDLARVPPYRVARRGIGLVPEGRRCFTNLSVWENLIAAARAGEWDFDRVAGLFPPLAERRDQLAASLSGGEQQMLAIARALMTNPKLMILDEATEGLAPLVRQEIWRAITILKRETGMALLVIDKSLKELREVADRATILERGHTVWTGAVTDIDDTVKGRFLGV